MKLNLTRRSHVSLGWLLGWLFLFRAASAVLGADPAPTRFTLREPAAGAVCLAGEFNGWNTTATPLRKDAAGDWSVEVPLPPGRYAYKFVVDGQWRVDPAATEADEDGLGGRNSVRVVGGVESAAAFGNTTMPKTPATVSAAAGLRLPPMPTSPVGRWTTDSGQAFSAEFLRLGNNNVAVFLLNGREFPYPLAKLVPADQRRVREIVQARQPAAGGPESAVVNPAVAAGGPRTFAGATFSEGETLVVNIPLGTENVILRPIQTAYGNKVSTTAKMFLAVPKGFAPAARPYPILVVSSTTDGEASSVGAAGGYVPDATDKGFVVIALDGEFGKPTDRRDTHHFRYALVQAGLNALAREWPASKTWPVATGGVSGGAGYASHQAIMFATEQRERPLLGMFLAVTGWVPTDFQSVLPRAPFGPFRQVPIFLSVGENDQIATPEHTEKARADLQQASFKRVRYEKFPGGHELWGEHLRAALDWFLETGRKANPPALPPAGG